MQPSKRWLLLVGFFLLFLRGAGAFQSPRDYRAACIEAATVVNAYEVAIEGVDDPKLFELLYNSSQLILEQTRPIHSFPALQYRTRSDIERLLKVLHSKGYYGAQITERIERDPIKVTLEVCTGPVYPLAVCRLIAYSQENEEECQEYDRASPLDQISLDQLCLQEGMNAEASKILAAEGRLLQILANWGYPLAKVVNQEIIVDQECQTVSLFYTVDVGPLCTFGPVQVIGLCTINSLFVTQCLCWSYGQIYNPCAVEKTTQFLRRSALFRSINITHATEAGPNGELPIYIEVCESKHRSIALGVSYGIYSGLGPEVEWQHRNLFGMGEDLRFRITTANIIKEVSAKFRKPHFFHCNQDLLILAIAKREKAPGFRTDSLTFAMLLDRVLNRHVSYSIGPKVEQMKTTHTDNDGDFSVLSLPLSIKFSYIDDLLDPTRGFQSHLEVAPAAYFTGSQEVTRSGGIVGYTKQRFHISGYYPLDRRGFLVVAGWTTIGTILGNANIRIPPPHRFFAGSDTELRGYKYKSVGPLGPSNEPLGGRSILLFGGEVRVRFNVRWGGVVFYEFGNVYLSPAPNLRQKQLRSVGFGIRYFTPVGPIGMDIAFPLDRRVGIDKPVYFYINIGQAF